MKSNTKKIIFLTIGTGVLTASIVTPVVILNQEENQDKKDVNKVVKILEEKNDKTIVLSSDSTGKIITNNQEKIVTKLKKLIGSENLKEIKIEVSMKKDTNISTNTQKIIIKLTKNEILKEIKDFLVKRDFTTNEDIMAIKNILDAKTNNDSIIILPSSSTGNIIGSATNKNEIIKKLRKLIDPLNTNGESNHPSLRETSIEISINNDVPISTTVQNIIVSISKTGGTTLETTKTFYVKRNFTIDEDIASIKNILDAKTGNNLIITLPSNSMGNIIGNTTNKDAIEKKLRMLIDPLNTNGESNHPSLRETSIEISMNNDAPISTTVQNIIVSISKTGGTTLRTTKTFRVKRDFTVDEDIIAIKDILDAKTRENLIITLPDNSSGNIIGNTTNKNEIEKQLRKLIDPSNTNGEANHPSLRGTTIEVSMSTDVSISTNPQDIVVSISKTGGTTLRTTKTFRVKRDFTINEDIASIKNILDAKTGENLIITLSSDSTGKIIGNVNNRNEIIKKIRKLIDPSNTNGEANHPSLRGTSIQITMTRDATISTTPQNIIVLINKAGGTTLRTAKIFRVKKD